MEAPTWGVFNEEHSPGKATRQATSWVVFKNTGENLGGVQKHRGKREMKALNLGDAGAEMMQSDHTWESV